MKPLISIIVPSWNNEQFLTPCVNSIYKTGVTRTGFAELIIINNGKQDCQGMYGHLDGVRVINAPSNLGWEGGIKLGLESSESPFLCFQNDDTFIPTSSHGFYEKLLLPFEDRNVAAVGPATTCAAGIQSIYHPQHPLGAVETNWMIFFTVMVMREHIMEVGGIDTSLPGGDDLDLCWRFRRAGKKVVVSPNAFLIHHGFKTGERVHGLPSTNGGWNSVQMSERTNIALIKKHGFLNFTMLMNQGYDYGLTTPDDKEGNIIREMVSHSEKVLEVGCGAQKTIDSSIGVDRVAKGEIIPVASSRALKSVADVVADITKELPFERESFDVLIARHILEHCVDLIETLSHWRNILKPGGKLIIAVPDQDIVNCIPLDPTHFHAFTQESLCKLMFRLGFIQSTTVKSGNGVSFVSSFEKVSPVSSLIATNQMEVSC